MVVDREERITECPGILYHTKSDTMRLTVAVNDGMWRDLAVREDGRVIFLSGGVDHQLTFEGLGCKNVFLPEDPDGK